MLHSVSWFRPDALRIGMLRGRAFGSSLLDGASAAQIYFLAPVPFARVMIGKNLSALFFISLEIADSDFTSARRITVAISPPSIATATAS